MFNINYKFPIKQFLKLIFSYKILSLLIFFKYRFSMHFRNIVKATLAFIRYFSKKRKRYITIQSKKLLKIALKNEFADALVEF